VVKKEDKEGKAEEPQPSYNPEKKVITPSSLENLQERNREHTRNLSYAERMEYLFKLNQNLYGFDWSKQEKALRKGVIQIRKVI
jgi:hypothetical protein